jgi:hypothetical protein
MFINAFPPEFREKKNPSGINKPDRPPFQASA